MFYKKINEESKFGFWPPSSPKVPRAHWEKTPNSPGCELVWETRRCPVHPGLGSISGPGEGAPSGTPETEPCGGAAGERVTELQPLPPQAPPASHHNSNPSTGEGGGVPSLPSASGGMEGVGVECICKDNRRHPMPRENMGPVHQLACDSVDDRVGRTCFWCLGCSQNREYVSLGSQACPWGIINQ